MIIASNVSKKYDSITACSNISFEVFPGEVTALLGPNGAGKTTILKILSGALIPTQGTVSIQGFDTSLSPLEAKAQTGSLFENNPLYEGLCVFEYLSFIGGMQGLPPKEIRQRVLSIITTCKLEDVSGRKIRNLSKGYRQRVALAQALIHDPPVLLLDEPTAGLDPLQLEEFRTVIRTISSNKTILLSTHIMQEVESLCTKVIMIYRGVLIEQGSIADICKRTATTSIEKAFISLVSTYDKELHK